MDGETGTEGWREVGKACAPYIRANKHGLPHEQMHRPSVHISSKAANLHLFGQDALKHFVSRLTDLAGGNKCCD